MVSLATLGARNNAVWCDIVCRAHGLDPDVDEVAWTCRTRTPRLYPDAVTLVPGASAATLLARIDTSAECSVKDSFASLDLTPFGFRVLFDAQWIVRTLAKAGSGRTDPSWRIVDNAAAFETWERVWRPDGAADVLTADLLGMAAVDVLGAYVGERVVAGAVVTCAEGVVGISNFFADPGLAATSWDGCVALAANLHPGRALVGYESSERLDIACAHGFETAGPLRVWVRDS